MRRLPVCSSQLQLPGFAPGEAPVAPELAAAQPPVAATAASGCADERQPWQMTLQEWMSAPRSWECPPRELTVNEWRSRNHYPNPLEEHGDFSHPHGISKAERRRMDARFNERWAKIAAGAEAYEKAKKAGTVPMITEVREIKADGTDFESQLAAARVYHRRSVMRAQREGLPVPQAVLADYPGFCGRDVPVGASQASAQA